MVKKTLLIFLIALAVIIQNTCPYGWAGKTVFVSPGAAHCPHCPIKDDSRPAGSDTQNDVKKDLSDTNHLFVIHLGKAYIPSQILSPMALGPSLAPGRCKDVYLEPPIRPPVNNPAS